MRFSLKVAHHPCRQRLHELSAAFTVLERNTMLCERVRPIETTGIIYHYCSPSTFLKIIENKTIRFSDINMLNDAEEGRYGYEKFIESANLILGDNQLPEEFDVVTKELIEKIDEYWSMSGLYLANFVSCFSSDGDSLSQWRAYADDGGGFAIGFDAKELRRLPIQMLDVLYDAKQQEREMLIAIGAIAAENADKNEGLEADWFRERVLTTAASSIAFKNPAWRDESEVRCQHIVDIQISDTEWRLKDAGGESDGQPFPGQPIQFEIRKGAITPFLDMPFEVSESRHPISEIVMGPKCASGIGNVRFLLGQHGFGVIPVRLAGAAYR